MMRRPGADPVRPADGIRDAATIVLIRDADGPEPRVLMGQRGSGAAFMPNKFVFPGGAVDAGDAVVPLAAPLPARQRALLGSAPVTRPTPTPEAIAVAAIRELWEEAGLRLGRSGTWGTPPADWSGFAAPGLCPDASGLTYVFRAITPPGRSRRFDARFFLARAESVIGDPDDFAAACDELGHLHWIALHAARTLDLPFVTEVVLAEAEAALRDGPPETVPWFDNSGPQSAFRRIAV